MFKSKMEIPLRVQRVVNKLVSLLGRQHVCRQCHADRRQQGDTRADCPEIPRLVKFPAGNRKLAVIIEQVCL